MSRLPWPLEDSELIQMLSPRPMASLFATQVCDSSPRGSLLPALACPPTFRASLLLIASRSPLLHSRLFDPADMDLCVLLDGEEPRPKSAELVTLIGALLERGA